MAPDVAPDGTITVSWVEVADVTVAFTPLNETTFSKGFVLKFVPVIVTVLPTPPLVGEKAEIVGGSDVWVTTVNDADDVTVIAPTVTVIAPVLAPEGTVTVS